MIRKGIDISKHQGKIDWGKVKEDGIEFAILRAGYGNNISQEDQCFDYNIINALANGIEVGAYWFSYAISPSDAIKEANVFLQVVDQYKDKIKYPLFFDFEYDSIKYAQKQGINVTNSLIDSIANSFMSTIKSSGWEIGNYTNLDFINSGKFSSNTIKKYPLWLADYTGNPDVTCVIQQTGSKGIVNGISGSVDMDNCYKDYTSGTSKAISDTNNDFTMKNGASYQFKITSTSEPTFSIGTANIFKSELINKLGNDYYYKITAIGNYGQSSGIYLNSNKICIVTIDNPTIISDTTGTINVKKNNCYQFKLTSETKPVFTCGNGNVFTVNYVNNIGNDYLFKVVAIGDIGQSAGFYTNGTKICVGNVI